MTASASTLTPLLPEVLNQAVWIYGLAAAVAMLIATVIKGLVTALNALQARAAGPVAGAPSAAGAAVKAVVAPPMATPGIPAAHVAAIAAAVQALDGAHRVVRIDDQHGGTGWAEQGRTAHHQSHSATNRGPKQ
jgi:hypothetical protein